MRDSDIVAAIVVGDPSGLAAAYDRYAGALHAYCRSLLAEPADAADAVQDTFVVAASKLDGLRDPDRLRPWLYAVARNECHRRLRARARITDLDEAGEMTDASPDVGLGAERGELRDLVQSAIAGLNPGEREVIELTLRHDLEGPDLAGALGVPVNQAHALASRARGQLERSLGALLVARTGREACPELDDLLAGWDGELTVLLRKRVSRHIENCDICGDRKKRELSPAMLLSALPVFMLPPGLREQVFRLVSDTSPEAVRYREHVVRRAEPFRPSGFPVPVVEFAMAGLRGRWRSRTVVYAAVAALIVIVAGGAIAAAMLRHGGGPSSAAAHSPVSPGPSASGPAPVVLAPTTGSSASPSPTRGQASTPVTSAPAPVPNPASPAPSPTKTKKPKPTPSPTGSSSSSPPPSPGTLGADPGTVILEENPLNDSFSGSFQLTADGGPVAFTIEVPDGSGLTVSPPTKSLGTGGSVQITVTSQALGSTTELTVTGGSAPITVTIEYPAPNIQGPLRP
jgi:RNA polymerase sigma factor (sigma-70 family)